MCVEQKGQVYKITNLSNGKCYIGQTLRYRKQNGVSVPFGYTKRFEEHKHTINRKQCSILAKAMREYGCANFTIELLEECEVDVLDDCEVKWTLKYNSLYPNGYNVLCGPPCKSFVKNAEARNRMSNTLRELFKNKDIRQAYSEKHRGKFKAVQHESIKKVCIHPIKHNGEYKIVYAYIHSMDGDVQRRRYGGIHEEYEEALERCCEDALNIVNGDVDRLSFAEEDKHKIDFSIDDVTRISVRPHKMKDNMLVGVYITLSSCSTQKRVVFGGKTVSTNVAFAQAQEFVSKISNAHTITKISESLMNVATSPN